MISWRLEKRKIKDLKPHSKNPRKLSEHDANNLAISLEKFGLIDKPILNGDQIIGGHQRISVLKKAGIKEIECWIPNRVLEQKEIDELNIRLNRNIGEWDFDILANEWDMNELLEWGFTEEEFMGEIEEIASAEPDNEVLESPKDPKTKRGDLYVLDNHWLKCGDSTDSQDVEDLWKFHDKKPPVLCFTSPPYSDQRDYNGNKNLEPEHLSTFIPISASDVQFYAVNLGIKRKDGEVDCYWNHYIDTAKACGLKLLSWNVWDQGFCGSVGKLTAMFPIAHEWIFVFGSERKKLNPIVKNKDAEKINNHSSDRQLDGSTSRSKTVKIRQLREMGTVFHSPGQMARDDIDHPARFPIELPSEYIKSMTDEGESVYDPFLGSGTTLIACEQHNRICYGIELDPAYCDIIVQRWIRYRQKLGKESKVLKNGQECKDFNGT